MILCDLESHVLTTKMFLLINEPTNKQMQTIFWLRQESINIRMYKQNIALSLMAHDPHAIKALAPWTRSAWLLLPCARLYWCMGGIISVRLFRVFLLGFKSSDLITYEIWTRHNFSMKMTSPGALIYENITMSSKEPLCKVLSLYLD